MHANSIGLNPGQQSKYCTFYSKKYDPSNVDLSRNPPHIWFPETGVGTSMYLIQEEGEPQLIWDDMSGCD